MKKTIEIKSYPRSKECQNEKAFVLCLKCGKCGRKFKKGELDESKN